MGLIREIQKLNNDLNNNNDLKTQKEKEKQLEKELEKDIENLLCSELNTILIENNNNFLDLLNKNDFIIDYVITQIKNIMIIEKIKKPTNIILKNGTIKTEIIENKIKKYNYDDDDIYYLTQKLFYKVFNDLKQKNTLKTRLTNDEIIKILINMLENDFISLNNKYNDDLELNFDCLKKIEYRNIIIDEIHKKYNVDIFTIEKNYNKAINFLKSKYQYEFKQEKENKKHNIKIPLGLKLWGYSKIIKSILK